MICTVIGSWGGSCKKNEACSGYLLNHDGFHLLLDCGGGVLSVMQNVVELNAVNDVLLTHYHYDHYSDAGVYIYSRLVNRQIGATDRVLRFYGLQDEKAFPTLTVAPYSFGIPIDAGSELDVGPFHCTFLKTKHPVDCLAVKVSCGGKTMAYTADTAWFEDLAAFAAGADLLIAECSLYAGHDGDAAGHMNSADVARLAKAAKPARLLLSHLPIYGMPTALLEDVRAQWDGKTALAERLKTIDLDGEDF